MQVTEVANEGLKRAYTVVVPAGDIAAEREKRLAKIGSEIRMPGFRPGKVPAKVVLQRYGQAVMGEVLEGKVNEATQQVVADRGLRPALQPKIEVVSFADGADLEFRVDLEIMPEIAMPDFAGIELERLKAEPTDDVVAKALGQIAERNRKLEDISEDRGAATGEMAQCDFVGRLVEPAPNLLPSAGLAGAEAGEPGKAPTDWRLTLSAGLVWSVTAVGEDAGIPWMDLKLSGTAQPKARVNLFLDGAHSVAAIAGQTFQFSLNWHVTAGALPADSNAVVRFIENSGTAGTSDKAEPLALPGAYAAQASASHVVTDEATRYLVVALVLGFTNGGAVDATIRLHAPVLNRPAEGVVGEPFPGGAANDMPIEVGGGGFIPGFTEQLEGIKAGEVRVLKVAFPAEYGSKDLAGRSAEFTVTCKGLKTPVLPPVDDSLATTLGFDDPDGLKKVINEQMQREYDSLSRMKVKRALLDVLSAQAEFEVPEGMVDAEFGQIWERVEADLKAGNLDADDKGKDEETLKADYRKIAQRRIRLGLLLSEIGRTNNINVSAEELSRAMQQEAGRYPGQEQMVMDYFHKNPQAAENLRSPIFEEKVVDFMLELAKVTDKTVTAEELTAAAEA